MNNEDKKILFSERLNKILDQHNFPPKNMGRVSLLAEMFSMTQKGAGNWINAKSIPPSKKINEICEKLKVSKEWLVFGESELSISSIIKIPVLKKEDLMMGNYPNGNNLSSYSNLISVQDNNSHNSFAINLEDEEFEVDFILSNKAKLIFDPQKKPADKLFALVKEETTIRISRLIEYNKNNFAIKDDHSSNIVPLDEQSKIIAMLTEIKF
jgi:hypothetical protein